MIEVAGITVPRVAISRLAGIMLVDGGGRMTGHRLAQAIDKNLGKLPLSQREADLILRALRDHPIEALEPLRQRLETRSGLSGR
jgi:hypothetical protein